jgi:tRNA modification GTPase
MSTEIPSFTHRATTDAAETIAAIATPPGVGGIGIVRISGPEAFAVGMTVFRPARALPPGEVPPSHQLTYGHVVARGAGGDRPDGGEPADSEALERALMSDSGEIVDEVLAVFMRAPRTYTAEDVVEIHAHGGPLVLRRILELALAAGARAARPGEMTLRAFLHGRIDLAQAEAVMALISAESDAGRRLAMRQLQGGLSARVQKARADALAAMVRIEASIDFPDEEVPPPDPDELAGLIVSARGKIERLLAGAEQGRILREGLRVVLVGRPNVGKSSLLNRLLGVERAIVTPIPGTTRDTIEERATLGGIALHLIDTAGLTPTEDPIERAGVERSRAAAASSDLVLFVLDSAQPLTPQDYHAAEELHALANENDQNGGGVPLILVLNKADLPPAISEDEERKLWLEAAGVIRTSAYTGEGLEELERAIGDLALCGQAQPQDALVSTARHRDALRRGAQQLAAATATLENGLPLDFVSIDLCAALEALGEITGETATADLLDRIFAEFCIGK